MLYQIENKYYIRVAPMKYTEVVFELKNDNVVIKTTQNKVEANGNMEIKAFDFQKEKQNIKEKLIEKTNAGTEKTASTNKYRKRR